MGKAAVIPVTSRSDSSGGIGSGSPAQSRIFSGWNRLLVREQRLRTRNHRFPGEDKSQGLAGARGDYGRLREQSCRACSLGQMGRRAVLGCPGLGAMTRRCQLFYRQLQLAQHVFACIACER